MAEHEDFWRPEDYAAARRLVEATSKFHECKLGNWRFRAFQWFCRVLRWPSGADVNLIDVICVREIALSRWGRAKASVRRGFAWLLGV